MIFDPSEEAQDETISLTVAEPDDLSEPKPKRRKLKDALETIFVTDDDSEDKPANKKPRKRKSSFFAKNVSLFVGGCMFLAALLAPEQWSQPFTDGTTSYTLLPNEQHWTAMLSPLARIADRHSNIAEVNPDVLDLFASLNAAVAYGFELRSVIVLKHYLEEQKQAEQPQPQHMQSFEEFRNNSIL